MVASSIGRRVGAGEVKETAIICDIHTQVLKFPYRRCNGLLEMPFIRVLESLELSISLNEIYNWMFSNHARSHTKTL